MLHMFVKGGPIMWPLLIASITALTIVVERLFFIAGEKKRRNSQLVEKIFALVQKNQLQGAVDLGASSQDPVARVIVYGIQHDEQSLSNALMRASSKELKRYESGIATLDTIITLAPLLGLLGTVTGMIAAFGLLGNQELSSPTVITGGIAEALIATAYGLGVAITALIPFNFLNAQLERTRHDIEDAGTHLELLFAKKSGNYEAPGYIR